MYSPDLLSIAIQSKSHTHIKKIMVCKVYVSARGYFVFKALFGVWIPDYWSSASAEKKDFPKITNKTDMGYLLFHIITVHPCLGGERDILIALSQHTWTATTLLFFMCV
jgi:hypothetical protein